jgi:hypothetical protein
MSLTLAQARSAACAFVKHCPSRSRIVQALSFGTLQTSFHILAREEEYPQKNDGRALSDRAMANNQLT